MNIEILHLFCFIYLFHLDFDTWTTSITILELLKLHTSLRISSMNFMTWATLCELFHLFKLLEVPKLLKLLYSTQFAEQTKNTIPVVGFDGWLDQMWIMKIQLHLSSGTEVCDTTSYLTIV